MRQAMILTGLLSASFLAVACNSSTPASTANPREAAEVAHRDRLNHDLQKMYDEKDQQYQAAARDAAAASGDQKRLLEEKAAALKGRRDAITRKLEDLKAADHDQWVKMLCEDIKKNLAGP